MSGFGTSLGYLIVVRSIATGAGEAFYAPAANAPIAEHRVETRARETLTNWSRTAEINQ
jgi:hypothetical protein